MIDDSAPEPISDETLMRFVDSDLAPDERSIVVAEIARSPDLAKRLEAFRFTREEFVDAFASALEIRRSLTEKLRAAGLASPLPPAKQSIVAKTLFRRSNLRRALMAMAAAVTLLLAGTSGWLLRASLRGDYAGLIATPSLQRALDETQSRGSAKLAGDLSIKVNSTFVSLQRLWCREYTVLHANRAEAAALACRGADGVWRIEVQEDPSNPLQMPTDTKTYMPAGEDRQQGRSQAETVAERRDRIMDADVSLQVEESLIKQHWQRKP